MENRETQCDAVCCARGQKVQKVPPTKTGHELNMNRSRNNSSPTTETSNEPNQSF